MPVPMQCHHLAQPIVLHPIFTPTPTRIHTLTSTPQSSCPNSKTLPLLIHTTFLLMRPPPQLSLDFFMELAWKEAMATLGWGRWQGPVQEEWQG